MKRLLAIIGLATFGLVGGTGIAYADAECLRVPAKTETVNAVTHKEQRWKREIPAVKEVSHTEYQFSRVEPKVDEVSHLEYRFSRTNPGHAETFTTKFKYKKTVPAVDGVKEYEYKKCTDNYVTEYQWEKWVKGTKEKRKHGHWVSDGTFDYRDYPYAGPVWDDGGTGTHNSTWTEGNVRYTSTEYKYVKTGVTREVKDGTQTCETEWALTSPGDGWKATGQERWKTEPQPEKTVLYNDGEWTTDTPGEPWVQVDEYAFSNEDYVAPFPEYKTKAGVSTDKADAAWFTESAFEGWDQFGDAKKVVTSPEIPEKTFYKTNGEDSPNIEDAAWFTQDSFEGWEQFNSKKVVTTEFVPGFTEYYVPDGDPTRELGDSNWTRDNPAGWTFVDERTVTDKAAYTKTTEAVYGPCELAFTGINDAWLWAGAGLVGLGAAGIWIARRKSTM